MTDPPTGEDLSSPIARSPPINGRARVPIERAAGIEQPASGCAARRSEPGHTKRDGVGCWYCSAASVAPRRLRFARLKRWGSVERDAGTAKQRLWHQRQCHYTATRPQYGRGINDGVMSLSLMWRLPGCGGCAGRLNEQGPMREQRLCEPMLPFVQGAPVTHESVNLELTLTLTSGLGLGLTRSCSATLTRRAWILFASSPRRLQCVLRLRGRVSP